MLGLVSSIAPNVIRYFERKQEIKYELEITRLKLEAATKGYEISSQLADINATVREGSDVRKHDAILSGSNYINALRASVRPVITYAFFGLFLLVKLSVAFIVIRSGGITVENALDISRVVLDEPTTTIFGVILGFWFGSRSFEKAEQITSKWFGSEAASIKVVKE